MPATVLIVEDNPITRKLVRLALSCEGFVVIEAATGREAVEAIRKHPIDLVLEDLALDDMDGFELLERLRQAAPAGLPPVLAFTGLADAERVRAAGFSDLVLKPIEPSALVGFVRAHLSLPGPTTPDVPASSPSVSAPFTSVAPEEASVALMQSRMWSSVSKLFANLSELTVGSAAFSDVLGSALASFLDFSGFSSGAAYLPTGRGRLSLRAQLGFGKPEADRLTDFSGRMELLEHVMRVAEPLALEADDGSGIRLLLDRLSARSLLLIPITHARTPIGVFVAASANQHVAPDWIELARLVAAPIGQSLQLAHAVSSLTASEHRFRGIAESSRDGIIVCNFSEQISYVNAAAGRTLGVDASALLGTQVADLLPFVKDGAFMGTVCRPDGREVSLEVSRQSFEDPPGRPNCVYIVRDLSERLRIDELAWLANHDPLTGLVNRRRFEEELTARLAESSRYGTSGALLALDLDEFKPINDTYGHAAGDLVLRSVGDVLRSMTRASDVCARIGGDEFVVLLSHTSPTGAEACARKLVEHIAETVSDYEGIPLRIAASVGVAVFPSDATEPQALLAAADRALYAAKQAGRRRVSVSSSAERSLLPSARPENAAGIRVEPPGRRPEPEFIALDEGMMNPRPERITRRPLAQRQS
jgi:diguanylate cyclase (GGDEF)-like protein